MDNRKWRVLVVSTGHIYISDPNENYLMIGSVLESHAVDSKEEAEALKAKLQGGK
jgi:hypothetical protein